MMNYIDCFSCAELSMHLWHKAYLIMVDDLFDVFLESVCKDFIECFCISVHNGDWSVILSLLGFYVVWVSG